MEGNNEIRNKNNTDCNVFYNFNKSAVHLESNIAPAQGNQGDTAY